MEPGAVYKPEADSVPTCGLNDQVTGSPVLLTAAANCCCPPCPNVLAVGLTEIVTAGAAAPLAKAPISQAPLADRRVPTISAFRALTPRLLRLVPRSAATPPA